MLTKEKALTISKKLFLVLVLIVPLNLGKHFIIKDAYVWGILVDYLIPTIYLQDILAVTILFLWFLSGGLKKIFELKLLNRREIQFATLFVFSTLFSVLSSQRFTPSVYFWLRLLSYFLIFIFIIVEISIEDYFFKILNIFKFSILVISVIGIFQYLHQGSIFNNYLMLGEQPYSASVWGVDRKHVLGHLIVPAYGIFRHPNTFGGFLSVLLVWLLAFWKKSKKLTIVFLVGIAALFCTLSYSAWLVFIFGVGLHFLFSVNPKNIRLKKLQISLFVGLFSVAMLVVPLFSIISGSTNPSIYRRSNLLVSSYRIAEKYPLFGVGLNNLTILIDEFMPPSRDLRFTQPVHNVFALVAAETGIFSFVFFVGFLVFSVKKLINSSYFHVLLISVLQIIILFSLDHYFFTINQTLLLFWLIMGLSLQ